MLDELFDVVGGFPGRVVGIALAVGAGVVVGRGLRPVAKSSIKGYLSLADRVKGLTAETGESLQDLYHEAMAEREQRMAEGKEATPEAPERPKRHRPDESPE